MTYRLLRNGPGHRRIPVAAPVIGAGARPASGALWARRVVAGGAAAATGLGLGGALVLPASAASTSASTASTVPAVPDVHRSAEALPWFHDPISPAGRRAEVAVPASPATYGGPLRATTATDRTHSGAIAVPISWAAGHRLLTGQAVVLTRDSLFGFDRAELTRTARAELRALNASLNGVRAVRCEGDTDFGGSPAHEQQLSVARARAICAVLTDQRPALVATAVGYAGTRPVVVGGSAAARSANRRVVVVVTRAAAAAVAPGAPRLSSVRRTHARATLTFTRPAGDGGSPITGYQVSVDAGRTWRAVTTHGHGPLTATVTGLLDRAAYRFAVRALSRAGRSGISNVRPTAPVVPVAPTAPTAPTLTAADPGHGSARIGFSAPAGDGGAPVTGYEVSTDGGATWRPLAPSGRGPFTATLTGLADGTTYAVTVRADNRAGRGAASNRRSVTPTAVVTTPGAPLLTALVGAPAGAVLTFSAPADDGGAPVTGYQVSTDGGTRWTALATSGTGPFAATLAGLTNGTRYGVSVRAVNRAGAGRPSNARAVTPAAAVTVPSAPVLHSAAPGDAGVTVRFTAPADGGTPITGYQISVDGGGTWATLVTSGTAPLSGTVTGLGIGDVDPVTVRAVNQEGNGPASNTIPVTVITTPSAPHLGQANPRDTGLQLVFFAPASDGGGAIDHYEISADGGLNWGSVVESGPGPYILPAGPGFTDDQTYQIVVRAHNAAGDGPWSAILPVTPSATVVLPTAPVATAAWGGDASGTIWFDAPTSDGGAPITSYEVSTDGSGATWTRLSTIPATDTLAGPYVAGIPGLSNGLSYQVTVRAVTSAGVSEASNAQTMSTLPPPPPPPPGPSAVPDAPYLTTAAPGDTVVTLTFTVPADGHTAITGYDLSTDNGGSWTPITPSGTGPPTYTITGLVDGAIYAVAVRADNAVGPGPASNFRNPVPIRAPEAPVLSAMTAGDGSAAITFTAATSVAAPVAGHQYTTDGTTWTDFTPTGTGPFTYTITGLTDGTPYNVAVRTLNSSGDSPASNTLSVTPTAGGSTAPTAPTITAGVAAYDDPGFTTATAHLSFTPPSSDGGSAITGYELSVDGGAYSAITFTAGSPDTTDATEPYDYCSDVTYHFTIRAVNANGDSIASNSVAVPFTDERC